MAEPARAVQTTGNAPTPAKRSAPKPRTPNVTGSARIKASEHGTQFKTDPNEVLKIERRHWKCIETGEVIEAPEITRKVNRQGFMITYLSAIINLIESLGNKKMQVVRYILTAMDVSSNTLIATTRELAERAEVSHKTVIETLKILKDAGIIAQRHGSLMVNSDLVHKGSHQKERFLVARFQEFAGEENGYRGDEGNEYDEVTSPDFPEEKQLTVYGN